MDTFIQKYQPHVKGVLSGFDRLVFRGNLMGLCTVDGMMRYLSHVSVLLKHFSEHAKRATLWLRQGSIAEALRLGRPVQYLRSSQASKEGFARDIAQRDGIRDGLIAVLTCVEPIWSFRVHRDPTRKRLVLRPEMRKGLQFYHYWMHPDFGFMHGRIATWFPFQIQVCINGREWLARRMDRAGLAYLQRDNSFPWIEDVHEAQRMMDEMQRVAWVEMLQSIAQCLNPVHEEMFRAFPIDYYWTAHQSEWATDLMFDERASIEAMYPLLTRGTMEAFNAEQVMRFLGHKPSANFLGEAYTDHRRRKEGVRVKHQMKANSVKVYDKGSILRVETTINDPTEFTSDHVSERDPSGGMKWLPMRKGIADLHRRSEVSQACNDRYLHALATLNTDRTLGQLVDPVLRPVQYKGHPARAINPWSEPDRTLLNAVNDGAYCLNGFRNRDIVKQLYPQALSDPAQHRQASARVTRMLRLLRAHGIIKRVNQTYRYQVTEPGRQILTAILQYQSLNLKQVLQKAA